MAQSGCASSDHHTCISVSRKKYSLNNTFRNLYTKLPIIFINQNLIMWYILLQGRLENVIFTLGRRMSSYKLQALVLRRMWRLKKGGQKQFVLRWEGTDHYTLVGESWYFKTFHCKTETPSSILPPSWAMRLRSSTEEQQGRRSLTLHQPWIAYLDFNVWEKWSFIILRPLLCCFFFITSSWTLP